MTNFLKDFLDELDMYETHNHRCGNRYDIVKETTITEKTTTTRVFRSSPEHGIMKNDNEQGN